MGETHGAGQVHLRKPPQ